MVGCVPNHEKFSNTSNLADPLHTAKASLVIQFHQECLGYRNGIPRPSTDSRAEQRSASTKFSDFYRCCKGMEIYTLLCAFFLEPTYEESSYNFVRIGSHPPQVTIRSCSTATAVAR